MNVIVGISWPFANGDLHIGHIGSSLSGDVIARFHRLKGNKVILISGTDCHGTPIDIKAKETGLTPKQLVDDCHEKFRKTFDKLNFSFDNYFRTDSLYHKEFVQEQFIKYLENGFLEAREDEQLYCESCNLFLADRYIVGICPKCGSSIKGEECEKCNSLLEIEKVDNKHCAICNTKVSKKKNKNLYFTLSKFEKDIKKLVSLNKNTWRENAIKFTERYISEGIPDRCATRNLNWGITVPIDGYNDKKIYGWFENVWGYITASKYYCEKNNLDWNNFWKNENNVSYFVHAKDNIPFHSIILPSLLLATKENYNLPKYIISDEYITIDGNKLSKSKGNYITADSLIEKYDVDFIRYYFLINDAEKRDFNFTWLDFKNSINSNLIGKWGNLVNRILKFINKDFNGTLDNKIFDRNIEQNLKCSFTEISELINLGEVKFAFLKIFDLINFSNKYFDENKPWILAKENKKECEIILYNCVNLIYNINTLLKPFIPSSCSKVEDYLDMKNKEYRYEAITTVHINENIDALFNKIDVI